MINVSNLVGVKENVKHMVTLENVPEISETCQFYLIVT